MFIFLLSIPSLIIDAPLPTPEGPAPEVNPIKKVSTNSRKYPSNAFSSPLIKALAALFIVNVADSDKPSAPESLANCKPISLILFLTTSSDLLKSSLNIDLPILLVVISSKPSEAPITAE